jgi:hypothetical protein
VEESHTKEAAPEKAYDFIFEAISHELVICNIYVRVFNAQSPVVLIIYIFIYYNF